MDTILLRFLQTTRNILTLINIFILYSHLFIAAYDVETPESLLIEITDKKAQQILSTFSNDYERIAACLTV